jgi:hypothetical protein
VKVAVVAPTTIRANPHLQQLIQGISASGDQPIPTSYNERIPPGVQAVACWGWRRGDKFRARGYPTLIAERGYIGDRFYWTSLRWNGLNGKGWGPLAHDGGSRWNMSAHGIQLKPWKPNPSGYALILGQVPSDQSVKNVNLRAFYRSMANELRARGHYPVLRPHPKAPTLPMLGVRTTAGTLAEDLAGAKLCVTWNSNSAVDSVLAGVPCVVHDRGSMAWEVTSHSLDEPVTMPERLNWVSWLAWQQWAPEELANGYAWQTLRGCMP